MQSAVSVLASPSLYRGDDLDCDVPCSLTTSGCVCPYDDDGEEANFLRAANLVERWLRGDPNWRSGGSGSLLFDEIEDPSKRGEITLGTASDVSRRPSVFRWGKRSGGYNSVFRWGKRDHRSPSVFRWGRSASSAYDGNEADQAKSRRDVFRWGKRSSSLRPEKRESAGSDDDLSAGLHTLLRWRQLPTRSTSYSQENANKIFRWGKRLDGSKVFRWGKRDVDAQLIHPDGAAEK